MVDGQATRVAATGSIALTGFGIVVICLDHLLGGGSLAGIIVGLFGLLLGLAFISGAVLLYRSTIRTRHTLRVAGWNLLGVTATIAILALVFTFQQATGGQIQAPLFSMAVVIAVSSMAHILIGVNDVRRIRAREVAEQNKRAAVINRFVRHNLRHSAQLLLAWGNQLMDDPDPETTETIGADVSAMGEDLSTVEQQVKTITQVSEAESLDRQAVDLEALLAEIRETLAEQRDVEDPSALFSIERAGSDGDGPTVLAGEELETALTEMLTNALDYGEQPVTVTIEEADNGTVTTRVVDNGPGIPEGQRTLIQENREESALEHGDGLGLWLAKWIVEAYEGTFNLPASDDGGIVEITLPAAR